MKKNRPNGATKVKNANTSSYALFADGDLDMSLNSKKKQTLKSLFKSALLFEERLIMSDAQVIQNKNFRELLHEDQDFANLFNKSTLTIAIRDEADFPIENHKYTVDAIQNPGLTEVLHSFNAFNKCKWIGDITDVKKRYNQIDELKWLDEFADIERYKIKDVGFKYAEDTINLFFSEQTRRELGDVLCEAIYKFGNEKRAANRVDKLNKKPGFGIAFFENELGLLLKKEGIKDWENYKKQIIDIALAPYLTALPKLLESKPYYTQTHTRRLNLLRPNPVVTTDIYKIIEYRSRLIRLQDALGLLTSTDIVDIKATNEYKVYRQVVNNGNKKDLGAVLSEYLSRIDDVLLNKYPHLKESKKSKREDIVVSIKESGNLWGYGISTTLDFVNLVFDDLLKIPTLVTIFWSTMKHCVIDPEIERAYMEIKAKREREKKEDIENVFNYLEKKPGGASKIEVEWFESEVEIAEGV